jgi:SAM-dependent methyltransferase
MSLADAWERNATDWIRWAREPEHDSYWRFHRDRFFELLPKPGRKTLDIGCGEGRVTRDLRAVGHDVVGIDLSDTMIAAAREADPGEDYVVGNAESLPFPDGHADLVISFMSLMDVDDMPGAVHELARVLEPGGRAVVAVVHPINSGHVWEDKRTEGRLLMADDYFERRRNSDEIERNGLTMTFESRHWTFEDYVESMIGAGLVLEALREVGEPGHPRWSRYPLFLHLRALKPAL